MFTIIFNNSRIDNNVSNSYRTYLKNGVSTENKLKAIADIKQWVLQTCPTYNSVTNFWESEDKTNTFRTNAVNVIFEGDSRTVGAAIPEDAYPLKLQDNLKDEVLDFSGPWYGSLEAWYG